MELDEKFEEFADKIRNLRSRPTDADLLEIYALYKQATIGDCNTEKPAEGVACQKWEAWNSKKGLDQTIAKQAYINKAVELEIALIPIS